MTLHEFPKMIQRSDEWHKARLGIVTASTVGQLLTIGTPDPLTIPCAACGVDTGPCISLARKTPTPLKTVHGDRTFAAEQLPPVIRVADNDTSRGLITTLAIERINGWAEETRMTADMWRGVEHEPIAREHYNDHHTPATEFGFYRREEPMPWSPADVVRSVDEDAPTWELGYSPDGVVGDDGLIEIKCPRTKAHFRTILTDRVPDAYMPQCQGALLVTGRAWLDFVSFHGGMALKVIRVLPDPAWFAAIEAACRAAEAAVTELVDTYTQAAQGLPMTERVLDLDAPVELKLA